MKIFKEINILINTKKFIIKNTGSNEDITIKLQRKIYVDLVEAFDSLKTILILLNYKVEYINISNAVVMRLYGENNENELSIFFNLKDNILKSIHVLKFNYLNKKNPNFDIMNMDCIDDIVLSIKTIAKHL